jgi:hypothetical protein
MTAIVFRNPKGVFCVVTTSCQAVHNFTLYFTKDKWHC